MQDATERFSARALAALRAAIADAAGNEVCLLGTLSGGLVNTVRVLARGNRHAAPAIVQVPRPGEVVIHNHPSGALTPSDADLAVAAALGNRGVGAYIVDNRVAAVYVVVEPGAVCTPTSLDPERTAASLAADGPVGAVLEGYEHRPQQLAMLRAVTDAFNDDLLLCVEAGTGTGKSLAYLLPAISWSLANQQRVVVSTHTINLQEQLVHKDLPLLTGRAGLNARIALVKGRGNYLCQRKAAQVEAQPAQLIDDELQAELRDLLDWAKRTRDGSLADLAVGPHPEVWEQVVSEHDNCLRARCPYYSSCFFYTARRSAAAADLLVVNHHLLMADLALRAEIDDYTQNAILPPSRRVIIDEAHQLVDAATAHFGSRVSEGMLARLCARLQSPRNPGKGVLPALALALSGRTDPTDGPIVGGARQRIERRLIPATVSLVTQIEQSFSELASAFVSSLGLPGDAPGQKLRVTESVRDSGFWRQLVDVGGRLATGLDVLAADISATVERIAALSDATAPQVRYLCTELGALGGRLRALAVTLLGSAEDDPAYCVWVESRARPHGLPALSLHRAPIDVAPLLSRALFTPQATAVLTSATLAVGGRFDFFQRRVGLDRVDPPERVLTLRIPSPFDFAAQALLAVPTDLPQPTTPGFEVASHAAMRHIIDLVQGGTFLLFTAYDALDRAWFELAHGLRADGFLPLRQGELSRDVLLRRFRAAPRAVLFATDSFWQGVDVRGDALRCVVIARLPFRVPTEPLEEARVEAIAARGDDPFAEHTLPQAAIKLQQGFGRLIRSHTDRGCVVVLDSRIAHKRYGQIFFDSLPAAQRCVAPSHDVFAAIEAFFSATH
jgi:ATP-dependent DNA helicase DinG